MSSSEKDGYRMLHWVFKVTNLSTLHLESWRPDSFLDHGDSLYRLLLTLIGSYSSLLQKNGCNSWLEILECMYYGMKSLIKAVRRLAMVRTLGLGPKQ